MQQETSAQDALVDEAGAGGHGAAGLIARFDEQLQTGEAELIEAPATENLESIRASPRPRAQSAVQ